VGHRGSRLSPEFSLRCVDRFCSQNMYVNNVCKLFQLLGNFVPRPLSDLCPWTPSGLQPPLKIPGGATEWYTMMIKMILTMTNVAMKLSEHCFINMVGTCSLSVDSSFWSAMSACGDHARCFSVSRVPFSFSGDSPSPLLTTAAATTTKTTTILVATATVLGLATSSRRSGRHQQLIPRRRRVDDG